MSRDAPAGNSGHTIDGLAFARTRSEFAGNIPGARLQRLAELECRVGMLGYRITGAMNERGKPELELRVSGELELVCQRCLKPLAFPLELDSKLELARSLEEIEGAEDEVDRVLASKAMDVELMVEDEAILALPMIPRHERCEGGQEAKSGTGRPSPFEALAALKGGRKSSA
jgi:uncharacterized protein